MLEVISRRLSMDLGSIFKHGQKLVVCRGYSARISSRSRRHLAMTSDEGALDLCAEEEVEAGVVEGRADAVIICATEHEPGG